MPPPPDIARRPTGRVRPADTPEPMRRTRMAPPPQASIWRRALNFLLVFAAVVLLADALVGERGLVSTMRARTQSGALANKVEQLRQENAQLRDTATRLTEDRTTIEALARKELGLVRPGEVLVVVKDVKAGTSR